MAPKPSTDADAAAAREARRRRFAEELSSALREEGGASEANDSSNKPNKTQSNGVSTPSTTSATSASQPTPRPKVSRAAAEALRDFFISNITRSLTPPTSASKLITLLTSELFAIVDNPRLLLFRGTVIDHEMLSKVLLVSDNPPHVTLKQRQSLCEQLFMRGALLAPKEAVPSELLPLKEALRVATLKDAPTRAYLSEAEHVKIIVNELLGAHGEPNYPFHELVEFPDASVPITGKSCQIALGGPLAQLPVRNAELWKVLLECVQIYIDKASKIPGTLKSATTRRF